jgi:hypothetical protein
MSTVALSDVTVGPVAQEFDRIFREHYQFDSLKMTSIILIRLRRCGH